jgi:hypothetical protein
MEGDQIMQVNKISNNIISGASNYSNNQFFHVLRDRISNETLLCKTANGNIGGIVDINLSDSDPSSSIYAINRALKDPFTKIEPNPDTPGYLNIVNLKV